MTTDLDRLLELHQIKSQTIDIGDNQLTFMEEREYQSLKSQIESKLAQADKFEALLQFIPKNSDGHATVECIFCKRGHHEDCIGAPQNCCCGYWENKVETTEQQELSQLREEIKTLKDQRLTRLAIKWVQCIKCKKDYVEFYPKQQCTCGSHESEEVDALLTDLLQDSRDAKQLRPIVKALREKTQHNKEEMERLASDIRKQRSELNLQDENSGYANSLRQLIKNIEIIYRNYQAENIVLESILASSEVRG